jgi:polyribonucleotide nucleotidyltransferase
MFIGWNERLPASIVDDMAAGDVVEQRAERRRRRRHGNLAKRSAAAKRPASRPTLALST